MRIFSRSSRAILLGGIFFITPVLIAFILISHALKILLPIGKKLAEIFNISTVFGAATVTIICLLILLLLCYISGMLVQKGLVSNWSRRIEDRLFLMFPSLQMLKYKLLGKAAETGDEDHWKAILLKEDKHYRLAFITGSDKGFLTVYIPDAPKMDAGELRVIPLDSCVYHEISMQNAMKALSSFGRDGQLSSAIVTTAK